jgi:hypothetical protein
MTERERPPDRGLKASSRRQRGRPSRLSGPSAADDLIAGAAKQDRVGSGEPIGVENATPTGRRTASASLPAPAGMGCRIPQVPRGPACSVQADEGVDGELHGVPSPCGFDRDLLRDAVT